MLERGRISAFQMAVMMYPTILATAVLIVPSVTAKFAKNDMWLSPIWASVIGFLTVYVACKLHQLYPGKTVIQYSEDILGRIPAKAAGFLYVFFYVHTTGIISREYTEFIVGAFLEQTPMIVVTSTMILICSFAVRGGIEVVARATILFVPLFALPVGVMIILLLPELEPRNILPFMEKGVIPSLQGAVTPQGWFSEFFLISFMLPVLTDPHKGLKWANISVFAVLAVLVITNLFLLFLFGVNVENSVFPLMVASRYVSIADFFENLESVVMAVWVVGLFSKLSVFFYATVIGTAQWLELSDYRPIVLPIGLLVVMFSFWDLPNFPKLIEHLGGSIDFLLTTFQLALPMLLLLLAVLRKDKGGHHEKNTPDSLS